MIKLKQYKVEKKFIIGEEIIQKKKLTEEIVKQEI